MAQDKRWYKTSDGSVIGGVCKGISEVYDWDVSIVRLVFVLLILFGVGSPILLYLILYLVLPPKTDVIKSINKDALSDDYTINEDEYRY